MTYTLELALGNRESNQDCPINCDIYSGRGVGGGGVGERGGGGGGVGVRGGGGDFALALGAMSFSTFI